MWDSVRSKLYYAGVSRDDFHRTLPTITEANRKNMQAFSLIALIGMLIMIIVSFFNASLVKNRTSYLAAAIASALIFLLSGKSAKKYPSLTYVSIYLFAEMLFAFGIVLGTFLEPRELAVSFPVLMFAVPQLFTDRPIRMNLAMLVALLAYFVCAKYTQNPLTFEYNATNIVPYSIISMIISSYMMGIKVKRYLLEDDIRILGETDQLTGLLNRRCFDQHLEQLGRNGGFSGVRLCVFDINGLKKVNDSIGHHAGDELIRAAAECIRSVFGPYGKCYRMAGDELAAILEPGAPDENELLKQMQESCANYQGEYIFGFSVSGGVVTACGDEDVWEMLHEADRRMYAAKAAYYSQNGKDRRGG